MLTFQHPGWIPSDPPASARHRAASWTGPAGRVSVWRCCSTRPVHTKHQTGRSVSCPPHLPVLRNNENVGWLQNVSLSLLTRKSIKWLVPAWGLIDWLKVLPWKGTRPAFRSRWTWTFQIQGRPFYGTSGGKGLFCWRLWALGPHHNRPEREEDEINKIII